MIFQFIPMQKMNGFNHSKIWKSFQDILVKKEELNTFAVSFNSLQLGTYITYYCMSEK